MRLAEGDACLAHQPVCEVRRGCKARLGRAAHSPGLKFATCDHAFHCRDAEVEETCSLEHRGFVVLHVLRIGQRQALHRHHQRCKATHDPARMPPHQFRGIGVLLLRHDRTAGGQSIRQPDKAERLAGPEDQFFRQTAEMDRALRGGLQVIECEVAIRDRIQTVGGGPGEA